MMAGAISEPSKGLFDSADDDMYMDMDMGKWQPRFSILGIAN